MESGGIRDLVAAAAAAVATTVASGRIQQMTLRHLYWSYR
jgi:hypothetical protein